MRKLIVLMMVSVICLSFVACGEKQVNVGGNAVAEEPSSTTEDKKEEETTSASEDIETASTTEGTKALPETTTEAETKSQAETTTEEETASQAETTSEPEFDANWAGAEHDMPIPEPPFSYEVDARSNGFKIASTDGGKDGDVTHEKILAYCNALKEAGFNLSVSENVIGERYGRTCYEFSAKHENGNSVELVDDGGGVIIFVTVK